MPDEDVFARLPRALRAAARALRDGLSTGRCDPYPFADGLERLIARAGGVAVLPKLCMLFSGPEGSSQTAIRAALAADIDTVDHLLRANANTPLDLIAARAAQRQIVRGDLDRTHFCSAFVTDAFFHYVVDARHGLLDDLKAKGLHAARDPISSLLQPVAQLIGRKLARRPDARRLRLASAVGSPIVLARRPKTPKRPGGHRALFPPTR